MVTLAFESLCNAKNWRGSSYHLEHDEAAKVIVHQGPLTAEEMQRTLFDDGSTEEHRQRWNGQCQNETAAATAAARAFGCLFEVGATESERLPTALLLGARACLWVSFLCQGW